MAIGKGVALLILSIFSVAWVPVAGADPLNMTPGQDGCINFIWGTWDGPVQVLPFASQYAIGIAITENVGDGLAVMAYVAPQVCNVPGLSPLLDEIFSPSNSYMTTQPLPALP